MRFKTLEEAFIDFMLVIIILLGVGTLVTIVITANTMQSKLVLCGGGSIPDKAIEWAKSFDSNEYSRCVVVSCYDDPNKRWGKYFSNIECIQPEELIRIDEKTVKYLVIEGGDQWAYVNRLRKKDIQRFYDYDVTIITTSASAMLLGEYYFTAESGTICTFEAKNNPELVHIGSNYLKAKHLRNTIVDTHFTERNRNERLRVFMEKCGAKNGIGIDEGTALCIDGLGNRTIFGLGSVTTLERGK